MNKPSTPPITDEILMAFADGVLDEPQFSTVAQAIENDDDLAARLEQLVEGAALAKAGFAPLLAPVPAALEKNVRTAIARVERGASWQNWLEKLRLSPIGATAFAAVIALLAIPSLYLLTLRGDNGPAIGTLEGPDIAIALDSLPSGESRTLPNGMDVTAIATFIDAAGTTCREFETRGAASYLAVACRTAQSWQTRLAIATTQDNGNYRPASGMELLDSYLQSIGAGVPLLDQDELKALQRPD